MAFLLASSVFILDRLTKFIALSNLAQGVSIRIIPEIFHLTLVLNDGTAFGLFKKSNIFFVLLSAVVICIVLIYLWRNRRKKTALFPALGLILGGASGNLVDRIAFGHVIDFLDFRIWPVFNIADSAITIGTFILVWKFLRHK